MLTAFPSLRSSLPSRSALLGAFAGAGIAAGAVSLAFGQSLNFHVFRQAALDLLHGQDLYEKHAEDYFKYSPTFALLFVPFAALPQWIAAPLWSLANFLVAFFGIDRTIGDPRQKRLALLIALVGIGLATDGDQSNLLVAGAMLLALHALERGRAGTFGALVTFASFVKLFPAIGALLALFTPPRGRTVAALAVSALLWVALPLLVVSPHGLALEYASWRRLLAWDHANHGWCAMSLLQDGLHLRWSSSAIQLVGLVVQLVPVAAGLLLGTDARWRRNLACSLLVFAVLFNHRAEYTSYVLSAIGVAIWFATTERRQPLVAGLVLLALVAPGPFFTRPDPSVTGLFTVIAAHRQFHALRVIPLAAVWCLMLRDLLRAFVEVKVSIRLRAATAR